MAWLSSSAERLSTRPRMVMTSACRYSRMEMSMANLLLVDRDFDRTCLHFGWRYHTRRSFRGQHLRCLSDFRLHCNIGAWFVYPARRFGVLVKIFLNLNWHQNHYNLFRYRVQSI